MHRIAALLLVTVALAAPETNAQDWFETGQAADLTASGFGLNDTGGSLLLNHPACVATDGQRLAVCDRFNNRVLIWNTLPDGNTAPDLVLGQPDFTANASGEGLGNMGFPGSAALLADGRVVVADTDNNRLLFWTTRPSVSGQPADFAIALNQLAAATGPDFGWPWGVWTDGTKLAASATLGGRLLIWNSFPTSTNEEPDLAIRVDGVLGTPRTITSNGEFLMVGEHNNPQFPGQKGNHVWSTWPTSDTQAPDFYLQNSRDPNYAWFQGVVLPDGRLMALAREIQIWDGLPTGPNHLPQLFVNGPVQPGDSPDLVVAGERVYVAGYGNGLVYGYRSIPEAENTQPDFVIGADQINADPYAEHQLISNPVPATNGREFVATSDLDRKLYLWSSLPVRDAQKADVVIQLQEQPWDNALVGNAFATANDRSVYLWDTLPFDGRGPDHTLEQIGSVQLSRPRGVAMDETYFYVGDSDRDMIWVWEGIPTGPNPADPVAAIPYDNPNRIHSDGTTLTVARIEPPRVSFFDVATLTTNPSPVKEIVGGPPQPGVVPLNLPQSAITVDGKVFLANTSFNQVVVWESLDDVPSSDNAVVLGQLSLEGRKPRKGPDGLMWPGALAFDGASLWVGEFKFSNGLIRFTAGDPINQPPQIFGVVDTTATTGHAFQRIIRAWDPEGGTASLDVLKLPDWLTSEPASIDGVTAIRLTGTPTVAGDDSVRVASEDPLGARTEAGFLIRVAANIAVETSEAPHFFRLSSPFPNPFGTASELTLDLDAPAAVAVRLYDMTGRLRARLVDRVLPGGSHPVVVPGGGLASGVYLLEVQVGDRRATRTLVRQ